VETPNGERRSSLGQHTANAGLLLFSVFAPHSIAAAEISLGIVATGWLVRTLSTGKTGLHRTCLDLPVCLFFLWTVASSFLSEEPRISIPKLQSAAVVFLFYLIQAVVTRRTAVMLVAAMILSGVAGTLYSVYDLVRGRGIVVESISPESPLQRLQVREGDAIWRINKRRIYSVADIDARLRDSPSGTILNFSLISQGEHVERPGLLVTDGIKQRPDPSGIIGSGATHRFRASGWTSHYETFSEILQILAQLAFGLALANYQNHGLNRRARLAFAAALLLAFGITFTAMRTALVALAIGIVVISFRALGGRARALSVSLVFLVLVFGAFVVYQTRAASALWLQDPSSSLRAQVATVGLKRVLIHPLFGHGMDSIHLHWTEWGFPGHEMVHMHSTPLQLAFDRGFPALIFWLWIMAAFWITASRRERSQRESRDANRHGILLGATGAIAAVFASSLVNYNFGDEEVVLVFWWLMGIVVVLSGVNTQPGSLES
jgi:O-antigen ligase/polysaccharide polymerase Wzy-like membrane protein